MTNLWDYLFDRRDFLKTSFLTVLGLSILGKILPERFKPLSSKIHPVVARYWERA